MRGLSPPLHSMSAPILSLSRDYTLQDGKMNAISISESNIDDTIIITQNEQKIYIPRAYIADIAYILAHLDRAKI